MSVAPEHFNRMLDRAALVFRILGTLVLLPCIVYVVVFAAYNTVAAVVALVVAVVGGMLVFHLLTSFRRCIACGTMICNFRVHGEQAVGKKFVCARCGGIVHAKEGFMWLRDFSG